MNPLARQLPSSQQGSRFPPRGSGQVRRQGGRARTALRAGAGANIAKLPFIEQGSRPRLTLSLTGIEDGRAVETVTLRKNRAPLRALVIRSHLGTECGLSS